MPRLPGLPRPGMRGALATLLAVLLLPALAGARVFDIERDYGAVPYEAAKPATAGAKVAWANGDAFNRSIGALRPGDVLQVPRARRGWRRHYAWPRALLCI